MPTRNRALVYIRKSVVRNAADAVSPERQRAACLAEAERHGWFVVEEADVYADAEGHRSGRTEDRPEWQRLRRRLRRDGTVCAVIVESLSRASRSVRDFFNFVEDLRGRGIALVSLKERFDTSSAIGQALLGMVAIINQLESDLASERMQSNIAYKKSQGRHWGPLPFGCQREGETGALCPSDETYPLNGESRRYYDALVRCYELYAQGELGYLRLARRLNAEGRYHRTRGRDGQPQRWTAYSVRSVLMMHKVYAGSLPVSGHNKNRPEEWIDGNFDPILSVDLCRRVEGILDRRREEYPRSGRRASEPRQHAWPFLLSRVVYCAECGSPLRGQTKDGERHYRHAKRGTCSQSWTRADALEAQAIDLLGVMALPSELMADLIDELMEAFGPMADEEAHAEWEQLDRHAQRLEGELRRLVDLAVQTGLDTHGATYRDIITERNLELEELRRRRADLERNANSERANLQAMIEALDSLATSVRSAAPAHQREALGAVFERLEVQDGQIVHWTPRAWCKPFF